MIVCVHRDLSLRRLNEICHDQYLFACHNISSMSVDKWCKSLDVSSTCTCLYLRNSRVSNNAILQFYPPMAPQWHLFKGSYTEFTLTLTLDSLNCQHLLCMYLIEWAMSYILLREQSLNQIVANIGLNFSTIHSIVFTYSGKNL